MYFTPTSIFISALQAHIPNSRVCFTMRYIFCKVRSFWTSSQDCSIAQNLDIAPAKHLEQCHQCDLRPLFNQYDCLSFCASTFRGLLRSPSRSCWGIGGMGSGTTDVSCEGVEVVMWKSTWRRLVCCIVGKAFSRSFWLCCPCLVLSLFLCPCLCPPAPTAVSFHAPVAVSFAPPFRAIVVSQRWRALLMHSYVIFCTALHSNVISFVWLEHRKPQPSHRKP